MEWHAPSCFLILFGYHKKKYVEDKKNSGQPVFAQIIGLIANNDGK
jgi:hypothetical protein